jgi:hypothetical protein
MSRRGRRHLLHPQHGARSLPDVLDAARRNVFGTGLSFLSLKLGTAILGFLTLPFIYLLGKEIGGNAGGTPRLPPDGDRLLAERDQPGGIALSALSALRRADALFPDPRPADAQPQRFLLSGLFLGSACMATVPSASCRSCGCRLHVCTGCMTSRKARAGIRSVWLAMLGSLPCSSSSLSCVTGLDIPAEFGFPRCLALSGGEPDHRARLADLPLERLERAAHVQLRRRRDLGPFGARTVPRWMSSRLHCS